MIATALITLLLACLQFGLYMVTAMQLRGSLTESTANAQLYGLTALSPQSLDPVQIRSTLCSDLVLVVDCDAALKLEQRVLASMSTGATPISGMTFDQGQSGDLMVRRAEASVLTFVPGVGPLKVRSSSIWMRP